MDDLIGGVTVEEYVRSSASVIFAARNGLCASVGFGDLALKELDPSHPAFAHVAAALESAGRAFATVKQFDHEFLRRREEAEKLKLNLREAKD